MTARPTTQKGKRITFDTETLQALDLLARDQMKSFQELADEAFRDVLQKHGRPTDLKDALRRSAQRIGTNDNPKPQPKAGKSRRRTGEDGTPSDPALQPASENNVE